MGNAIADFSRDETLLKRRFAEVWDRNLRQSAVSKSGQVSEIIINRHQELHRHYHNTRHLAFCLSEHREAQAEMTSPDIIELALWFHDVVYVPNARDNEEKSAALFMEVARNQLSDKLIQSVAAIIPATCHQKPPRTVEEAYVLDIDLASLGLPWEEFNRDNQALRAEAPRIHDNLYYEGKVAFLSALLERDNIYYTDYFSNKYERNARNNINRYLESAATN